ncbi:hypothetical protein JN11_03414 [Mucilaginibacter frigoritolerans]|uniref:Uncharacterized protein n=1 Tax=Mucilaginibacter frigoritolerans TaxID=652788 RepID=A0A562TVJ4_9SPHI|nr:hypothetical protein [Mucilaginibacter frigoritolerans]TWI97592.1 hypothetical protein JN11_03414 [Mucilaginibacter frigoritolerans]
MKLFKKFRREVIPAVRAGWKSKAANRLGEIQTRIAVYLNAKTANLSTKAKWVFLVLVCLLFGGLSLYLLVRAFM